MDSEEREGVKKNGYDYFMNLHVQHTRGTETDSSWEKEI